MINHVKYTSLWGAGVLIPALLMFSTSKREGSMPPSPRIKAIKNYLVVTSNFSNS